jgi:hypothetical protein
LSGCGTDVWLLDPLPLTLRSQKDLPLSTEEWVRAARLVRQADRLAFVAGRVLARMLLARTASCEPRVICLVAQVSRPPWAHALLVPPPAEAVGLAHAGFIKRPDLEALGRGMVAGDLADQSRNFFTGSP